MVRFLKLLPLLALVAACGTVQDLQDGKIPVIAITDLYFPGQDTGDNFDILTPFAQPNIDLKAVVFDVTQHFRVLQEDNGILRDPGFIPVTQLNYLFDKDVPCGCSPFEPLEYPEDPKTDVPEFQQKGIELLIQVLESSPKPVHIVSTGSLRPLAVAFNRRPELLCSDKVAAVHVCAGASSDDFLEWNIALDTLAAARVLRSGMRMDIYPCATSEGPFDKGVNNSFWALDDLDWILSMPDERLRNYLVYNMLMVSDRPDYLGYLEAPLPEKDIEALKALRKDHFYGSGGRHYVWETAVWQQVADIVLVEHRDGSHELVPSSQVANSDLVTPEQMWPVTLDVKDNGLFTFERVNGDSPVRMYFRAEPWKQEKWLCEALPKWYKSFRSR